MPPSSPVPSHPRCLSPPVLRRSTDRLTPRPRPRPPIPLGFALHGGASGEADRSYRREAARARAVGSTGAAGGCGGEHGEFSGCTQPVPPSHEASVPAWWQPCRLFLLRLDVCLWALYIHGGQLAGTGKFFAAGCGCLVAEPTPWPQVYVFICDRCIFYGVCQQWWCPQSVRFLSHMHVGAENSCRGSLRKCGGRKWVAAAGVCRVLWIMEEHVYHS